MLVVIPIGAFVRLGRFLAKYHRVLRLLVILTVFLDLRVMLGLRLMDSLVLRSRCYAVDHDLLLTSCLSETRKKV